MSGTAVAPTLVRLLLRCLALLPVGAALALLGACASSPPARFYTLSETAPAGAPPAGVGTIVIGGVTIPGEIDRPQIVRRMGPNQLSLAELDRWAAPLDEMIRRVLLDDIARRTPPPGPNQQQHAVSVDIHEFFGDAGCNVTLRAVWTLKQPGDRGSGVARQSTEEIRVPSSGSCPTTLAETMSVALGQLSDRIVAGVAR
jgi:uncharacterized lipoprotein YmbA